MKVKFFIDFTKKVNSMVLPATDYKEYDVVLKQPSSVTNPIIDLSININDYYSKRFNYCYIEAFNRYYFISNTTMVSANIIRLSLSVDVLASYKSYILNSTAYIKRSASDGSYLIPDEYTIHNSRNIFRNKVISETFLDPDGCYILSVVGKGQKNNRINPTNSVYVLDSEGISALTEYMFDNARLSNIDNPDLVATFFNPFQYITSCIWLPLKFEDVRGEETTIQYGWYNSGINAYYPSSDNYIEVFTFTLSSYADGKCWTDLTSDWTRHALFVPGFQTIEIDPIYIGKEFELKIDIDFSTGDGELYLQQDGKIISQINGKLGSQVPISQLATNPNIPTSKEGLINTGAELLGSIILGRGANQSSTSLGVALGSNIGANAIDGLKQTLLSPTVSTSGSNGSKSQLLEASTYGIYIFTRYFRPILDISTMGLPVNERKPLTNLHGYTQLANGTEIAIPGLMEERNALAQILEGGFYIE